MSGAVIRELKAGGRTYTLAFKFGTMRQAEGQMGKPVFEALQGGLGMNEISAIVWAALQPAHEISRDEADALLDEVALPDLVKLLASALQDFFGAKVPTTGDEGNAPAAARRKGSRPS